MAAFLKRHWRKVAGVALGAIGVYVCPYLEMPWNEPCAVVTRAVLTVVGGS